MVSRMAPPGLPVVAIAAIGGRDRKYVSRGVVPGAPGFERSGVGSSDVAEWRMAVGAG